MTILIPESCLFLYAVGPMVCYMRNSSKYLELLSFAFSLVGGVNCLGERPAVPQGWQVNEKSGPSVIVRFPEAFRCNNRGFTLVDVLGRSRLCSVQLQL